jgi:mannose-6-phosphate isomerase-like protein (cupin superfamily)
MVGDYVEVTSQAKQEKNMSHSTGPIFENSVTTEPVEHYLIVPQNSQDRPIWYASSDLYTSLVSTVETEGDFNSFDFFLPPGGGPPLHYHTWEDEAWYGIEGNLFFGFGNEAGEMGSQPKYRVDNVVPGTLIYGPTLRSHIYGNVDSTETTVGENKGARTLSFTAPGGLDLFFNYVGVPVEDRNDKIPTPQPPTPEQFQRLVEIGARVGGAPYFVLPAPDYEPPKGSLDYVVVLPHNPPQDLVDQFLAVKDVEGFSIWQKDNDPNIDLPNRPTFTGPFGIEYTSLLTLEETGGELAYNEFSLNPGVKGDFPKPVESGEHEALYVKKGQLSLEINGEVTVAHKDDLVYIAPGNEYSVGNFGNEKLEALSVTIIDQEEQYTRPPSPIKPLPAMPPKEIISLSDGPDVFSEPDGSRREINARKGDDIIAANQWDRVKGQGGNDIIDASGGKGGNRLFGGGGNDQITLNKSDRAFGMTGDDVLDASEGKGRNGLWGGDGNDTLLAGKNDKLVGGEGNDGLYIVGGGNNVLFGGTGSDQFWLANNVLPDTVPEPRQNIKVGPPFQPLPPLEDTRNTIADFELGVDKIGIKGISGIESFEDLKLLPAFGDIQSTSIVAVVKGVEAEISLGNVLGVTYTQLSANDFVFV